MRFKGVSDKNRLEKQLDSIIIGGLKMYLNLPKYGRAKAIHNRLIADNGRQGQGQKEKGGIAAARSLTLHNAASNGTYAEILATNTQGEKKWYTDAWVGRLKKLDTFERAEDEITWTLGSDVMPKYLGDDMVILLGLSDSKAKDIINEETDKGTSLFYSLEKWKPDMKSEVRLVWIQCWGIPIVAWDIGYIRKIVEAMGDLVDVDDDVEEK